MARLLLVDAMRRVSRGTVVLNPTASGVLAISTSLGPDQHVAWGSETAPVSPGAVHAFRRLTLMTSAMRSRGSRLPCAAQRRRNTSSSPVTADLSNNRAIS